MSLSGTIRAGAAYVEVTAQTSKLQRGLATAQAQLQNFGRSCTAIGRDMLMLSGAFAVPMAMAVKGFADFDDQMRLVKAVTKSTKAEFESLTQVAAKLGRETAFTAKQVADGMVSLGRMGFSPKEIEQAIQPTLDLARATGTDLGEAANIAANSMRIFGIEASKMSDVADILTATANGSAQTLTDLFEALKMAGPQAKAAGENITDTSAALGVLANLGIKGSLAGTALRKSFSQFAKTKVQDKLKAVGISTVDANGNLRKMAEIIADIGRVMATMPSAEKLAFAEDIFDIRGSLAGLSLGGNVKELDAFIEKLYDVKGTARTTAQEMDDGLGGSFRKLLSAVEGAMNAIGKALEGTLKPFIDKITATTLAVIKWIEANSGLVTAFATTIAGTAALGAALIVIGVAAKGAVAGFAVIQTAIKGFTFLQGVCIAQGVALRNSISLIGASFVNFRNVAVPAMVGTEQLCAAFGLASTAANRTAASIVLMSNAEAAATAKSILAAKWTAMAGALKAFRTSAIAATIATKAQAAAEAAMAAKGAIVAGWVAMTNTLKGMTLATAAATVTTYAHTAAEAICTAGTIALNKARQIAIATTALFTAANLKAVVSISAVTVGNFLLAAAAKVAAVAMMALSAVMTLIAAHPVAAALIALGIILAGVCICLYLAANYTAKLSDEAGKLREKNDELRKTDQLRIERLKQLSEKQKLTNAEMAEARQLAKELRSRYGDLGITISENTVRIKELDSAAKRLGAVQLRVENAEDMEKLKRLKELSLKVNLSVPERNEAAGLIEDLSGRYGDLGMEVDRVKKKIILLSAAAQRLQGIRMTTRIEEPDLAKFDKLKSLSLETKLTFEQQGDAEALIAELSEKYGDLGIVVNRTTGQIERLNTVAGSIADLIFKVRGIEDIRKLQRLKQLSLEAELTVDGQQEAARLIAELTAKYGDLGLAVETTGAKVAAVNDAVVHMNRVRVAVDDRDLEKFDRLKALTQIVRLDVQGQQEAETLIAELSKQYGDLGIAVDKVSGEIVRMNTAAGNLRAVELTVTDKVDLAKIHDLQGMSLQTEMTVAGMDSAERMIAELEDKYGSLGVTVDRTTGKIVTMTEAASRVRNIELSVSDGGDLEKLTRLRTLSMQAKLDVQGQSEAEALITSLSKRYGDLGLAVDRASGKIVRMNTVAGKLQDIRLRINDEVDLKKFDRLKKLSAEIVLTTEGQAEAEKLVSELSAKYGDLGITMDRTAVRIAALNAEAARIAAVELEVKDTGDLTKLRKLKALSLEVKLDVDRQNEAESLISDLSRKYGDLGVSVDRATGKIVRLNSVAASLREIRIKVSGTEDADKAARLQALATMPKLDASGISEATTLIDQLKAKYGDLGLSVDAANGRIVALPEAQRKFAEAQDIIKSGKDPLKETHLAQLERLKKLCEQEKLTAAEQAEAQSIVNALNGAYNGLGLGIDAITGKLKLAAGAQQQLNDAMKKATLAELDAEIAELEANIRELGKENESLMSYWNHNLMSQITGRQQEAVNKIEANGDKMAVMRQKIGALRQRKQAVEQDKPGATTGTDGKPGTTTAENVEAEKQRRQQSRDAADEAAKRVAEIDKMLARERKTDLEDEIDNINALRDEYKALIQTMLDYEKSKPEGQQDKAKIADLEGKLRQADVTARERIAKAQEKAAEKMKKDVADFQRSFEDAENSVRERRAEDAQDRQIDSTLKSDKDAGIQMLQGLIQQYQQAAEAVRQQFQRELLAAQADGKIDDNERERISAAQAAYTRAESLVDKYSDKLRSAQDSTESAADRSQTTGSFLAAALTQALGGGGNEAARTANATEQMARTTKETNKILKKMGRGGSSESTLAYT